MFKVPDKLALSSSSSSKKLPDSIQLEFQAGQVFVAGSQVKGTVVFDEPNAVCDEVVVRIRGIQRSTYAAGEDKRRAKIILFEEKSILWHKTAPSALQEAIPVVTKSASDIDGKVRYPFSFTIPPLEEQHPSPFPPSFAPGRRLVIQGGIAGPIGGNFYFVEALALKPTKFRPKATSEKHQVPFAYILLDPFDPLTIPPPLVAPPSSTTTTTSLPAVPPPPPMDPVQWKTIKDTSIIRSGIFRSVKGWVKVTNIIPNTPSYPRINASIPIYTILTFIHRSSPSEIKAPSFELPSLSALQINLRRAIWTRARGRSQVLHHPLGNVCDVTLQRVWYGSPSKTFADPLSGSEGQLYWGCEISVVNEMSLKLAQVSFQRGQYNLDCSYQLVLALPIAGAFNNLSIPFAKINISSGIHFSPDIFNNGSGLAIEAIDDLVPPSYFEATAEDDDDDDEDEKRCLKDEKDKSWF